MVHLEECGRVCEKQNRYIKRRTLQTWIDFCSLIDSMATVGSHYREAISLGVSLNLIANVAVLLSWSNCGQEVM